MSNTHTSEQSFNEIAELQEISSEMAATVQGGAAMTVYKDHYYRKWLGSFDFGGKRALSPGANDQITSISIKSGRWQFFEHANYGGRVLTLGPGNYHNIGVRFGNFWNDRISSFRRIA